MRHLIATFLFILIIKAGVSQVNIRWWNPANSKVYAIQGQGWHKNLALSYDRLPERLKKEVRKPVWSRSRDAAGLIIRFRAKTCNIIVRYTVSQEIARSHIPATGASGIDLYATDNVGHWEWSAGKYHFGDTITYKFFHLLPGKRNYYLYLPYYNQVKWLEIGVPDTATLLPQSPSSKKPIVVYGTSIAQGIAASRPGMTWPAQLGRSLHRPVINLAFSGNGRLEAPIIGLMKRLDACIYILDCMPNLWYNFIPSDTVQARLIQAVKELKEAHPQVPIILTEDADINIMPLDTSRYAPYERVNAITRKIFIKLRAEGVSGLYLLTASEIGLNIKSTVEGTHPNDYGMYQYAKAYEKKIREIFNYADKVGN